MLRDLLGARASPTGPPARTKARRPDAPSVVMEPSAGARSSAPRRTAGTPVADAILARFTVICAIEAEIRGNERTRSGQTDISCVPMRSRPLVAELEAVLRRLHAARSVGIVASMREGSRRSASKPWDGLTLCRNTDEPRWIPTRFRAARSDQSRLSPGRLTMRTSRPGHGRGKRGRGRDNRFARSRRGAACNGAEVYAWMNATLTSSRRRPPAIAHRSSRCHGPSGHERRTAREPRTGARADEA